MQGNTQKNKTRITLPSLQFFQQLHTQFNTSSFFSLIVISSSHFYFATSLKNFPLFTKPCENIPTAKPKVHKVQTIFDPNNHNYLSKYFLGAWAPRVNPNNDKPKTTVKRGG